MGFPGRKLKVACSPFRIKAHPNGDRFDQRRFSGAIIPGDKRQRFMKRQRLKMLKQRDRKRISRRTSGVAFVDADLTQIQFISFQHDGLTS